MSATKTVLMQDDKRGESPRKQLRLPAIAPKDDQSSTSSSRSGRIPGPAVPHRQRLPPRSRTGCWTCRHRKVKCDEGRPICGQCARLGHACDYSPRLSFRDDTQRVVERMQDVTVAGSTVWNGQSTFNYHTRRAADASVAIVSPTPSSAGSAIADDLPPFPSLTTDEERERKAEASSPGTYNVVVNPDSFQHLPEYSDDVEIKRERLSPLRRGSIAASLASSFGRESSMEGVPVRGDPNTVILPRFEDLSRRSTRELRSPISPTGPASQPTRLDGTIDVRIKEEEDRNDEESRSLEHFRSVVWKHLVPTEDASSSSFTLVERIAKGFRPLFHAMLAVAFQSNRIRDRRENFDALQHYDLAIEHLKREEDLSSDGVFLTHFLMLIYEIATANVEHSLIRTHHVNALLKITHLRRQTYGGESFPYIIWWICNIDLDNLFSGVGNGAFVTQMLAHDVVPPPSFHLYPLGNDGSSVVYAEERESLPIVLQLDYDITLLAVRLVTLSQEFRSDESFGRANGRQRDMTVRLRQSRLYEIQEALRRLWLSPTVMTLTQMRLSTRAQRVWDRAFTLYRACIIFSHTSMWSAQHLDTPFEFEEELALASSEILLSARGIIDKGHLECRFLAFPLFISGFASTNGSEKQLALDLLIRMEQESIGRNISKTRRALGAIYERQNERFLSTGHSLDIDWMDVMAEHGLSVVSFGM